MAELRRLLINPERLRAEIRFDRTMRINPEELHYLHRVLRLRNGDLILVVDGVGNLWEAKLQGDDFIKLVSDLESPCQRISRAKPLIGLAVVLPKKGFDDVLRMSCEIGVDIFQPLVSQRSVVRVEGKTRTKRWEMIVREAVEQSERLWSPEIARVMHIQDWLNQKNRVKNELFAFASPRMLKQNDLRLWLNDFTEGIDQIWLAIGPEGGWTDEELQLAKKVGFVEVQLSNFILRTSTAAVVASESMVFWRRTNPSIYD